MILITVKFPVKRHHADDWPQHIAEFTAATRAEPGNISFEWFRSLDEPNTWLLVEVFEDDEAGAAHVSSPHFAKAMAILPALIAAPPLIINMNAPNVGWAPMGELSEDA